MKLPEPFYVLGEHLRIDLPGARAMFTTRRGGNSGGPYASLNLGRFTEDEPQAVARNRAFLESELPGRLMFVHQVHGTEVIRRSSLGIGDPSTPAQADGQATAVRGLALAAVVADCLPIALAGDGVVAMLHAGWRGLAGGVVANGVRAVRELGADGRLTAAIGPGAGVCCYKVGQDVHAVFAEHPEAVHRGRNLDLKAIARYELEHHGVTEVHDAGLCTICCSLFYSHRRDRGITGRQAGVAWLT